MSKLRMLTVLLGGVLSAPGAVSLCPPPSIPGTELGYVAVDFFFMSMCPSIDEAALAVGRLARSTNVSSFTRFALTAVGRGDSRNGFMTPLGADELLGDAYLLCAQFVKREYPADFADCLLSEAKDLTMDHRAAACSQMHLSASELQAVEQCIRGIAPVSGAQLLERAFAATERLGVDESAAIAFNGNRYCGPYDAASIEAALCTAAYESTVTPESVMSPLRGLSPLIFEGSVEKCPEGSVASNVCELHEEPVTLFKVLPIFAMILFTTSSVALACFLFTRRRLHALLQRQQRQQQRLDMDINGFALFRSLQFGAPESEAGARGKRRLTQTELSTVLSTLPLVRLEDVLPEHSEGTSACGDDENVAVDEEDGVCCAVCLDKLVPKDELYRLDCAHLFHSACLSKWLQQGSNGCPVCRRAVYQPSCLVSPTGESDAPRAAPSHSLAVVRDASESFNENEDQEESASFRASHDRALAQV